ncbi:MAG: hypothetical protein HXK70_03830 [Clostridiales bacterium]|nr:hypothetical protein [Clostridiales bacterium]
MKRIISKKKRKKQKNNIIVKILFLIIVLIVTYGIIENNKIHDEKSNKRLLKWEEELKKDIFHARVKTIIKESEIKESIKKIGLTGIESKNIFFSVYDNNENIIYKIGKDGENLVPASIAKIYTLVYVLDILKDHDKNTKVRAGNEIELNSTDASSAGLLKGKEYIINDLISSAVIISAGDSVYTLTKIAYNIEKGLDINNDILKNNATKEDKSKVVSDISEHITKYLEEKVKLSADTRITDPTGILNTSKTTYKDMYILMKYIYSNRDKMKEIISNAETAEMQISGEFLAGRGQKLTNTNPFLNNKSSWYEDGVIGLKTGTLRGWNNLFSIFKKNNGNYYGIITVGFENRKDVNILTKELIRRIKNESINSKSN